MKLVHKYTTCYNGYVWSICGIAIMSRTKKSKEKMTKDWKKVTCKNCLKHKNSIKKKLQKALKNF